MVWCHGCKKNQPGSERSFPQQDQAGSEGRTEPRMYAPQCVPGALVASKPLVWQSTSPVLQCAKPSSSPVGPVCSPGCPSAHSKAGGTDGGCRENWLGMPKRVFPLLSDLEVHFQPKSDGENVLVSQLASFRDEQQLFPLPGSGASALSPHPGCSMMLLGAAARLPGRLLKS